LIGIGIGFAIGIEKSAASAQSADVLAFTELSAANFLAVQRDCFRALPFAMTFLLSPAQNGFCGRALNLTDD